MIEKRFYCGGGECMWLDPILAAEIYRNWVDCTDAPDTALAHFVDCKSDRASIRDAHIMDAMTGITHLNASQRVEMHERGIAYRLEEPRPYYMGETVDYKPDER